MYPIISSQELAPAINKLIVKAPLIARKREPGNFVILRAALTGERIPLTIVDSDPDKGTITLIVQSIGKTTMLINSMKAGDELIDVAGPLGEPTPVENHGTVVCIGGGVGTAVVYPIAKALSEAGNDVISIIGARNAELVILEEEMKAVSRELMITTDDGSAGRKGFVTDALKEILERPGTLSAGSGAVYAMGPMPMMRAVSDVTRDTGIRTWVSLNPIMMDGTGMCGACRVTVGDQLKFACVDGPEFDAHQINFDELIARNRTYADLEKKALETCKSLQT
ncbi:sulfide/dihydroorotate dehydrogenase-like FAD/NAD-binding protein [Natronogracilivirga saccharolytica]|uniref:Sulfide/dihydroorotate dehydrogenase-like FAD/NAD-binding protein n=1 Tax=Natronogracilivirga saccharolytica TaxID=2812953 RepID=A0A8J7RRM7_9BACT|nr:sulfide/dihydroorotate dehydrogenase-like FAD/NAD-binding protein [Natronogracilivirga saccharolytica]MBP3191697.1 sulfide/dihydroorotate dehydrogenase-like FAD/NAD-binding protein [Natronogracilivirga saccharolytica]